MNKRIKRALSRIAEIEFIGWQPGQNTGNLMNQIEAAIADQRGWDMLFFAGHSNETASVGGELAIAPNTSISINEIADSLKIAKDRGLQFAIFNSCSGLNIAASLIDLGLSQVAGKFIDKHPNGKGFRLRCLFYSYQSDKRGIR